MKLGLILFLFFMTSVLLIFTTLKMTLHDLRSDYNQQVRLSNIQHVCAKENVRNRKIYTPSYSLALASHELAVLLKESPLLSKKESLIKIATILNHLRDRAVLIIEVHQYAEGSAKKNLQVSQENADKLKTYLLKKTNLVFISAIGFGAALPLKNQHQEGHRSRIKMSLQRINK